MSFLTFNGFDIPIKKDSASSADNSGQSEWRSVNGRAQSMYTTAKQIWSFETILTSKAKAFAIAKLLHPLRSGHYWDCSNLYSSKLLEMTTGDIIVDVGAGKFEDAFQPTASGYLPLMDIANEYTLMGWVKKASGSPFVHYIERSDGAIWEDGVRNDSATTTFVPFSNEWNLNRASSDTRWSDLVYYPFEITDAWATEFDRTQPHSDLPHLRAGGDFYESELEVVVSGAPEVSLQNASDDTRATVSFSLREV